MANVKTSKDFTDVRRYVDAFDEFRSSLKEAREELYKSGENGLRTRFEDMIGRGRTIEDIGSKAVDVMLAAGKEHRKEAMKSINDAFRAEWNTMFFVNNWKNADIANLQLADAYIDEAIKIAMADTAYNYGDISGKEYSDILTKSTDLISNNPLVPESEKQIRAQNLELLSKDVFLSALNEFRNKLVGLSEDEVKQALDDAVSDGTLADIGEYAAKAIASIPKERQDLAFAEMYLSMIESRSFSFNGEMRKRDNLRAANEYVEEAAYLAILGASSSLSKEEYLEEASVKIGIIAGNPMTPEEKRQEAYQFLDQYDALMQSNETMSEISEDVQKTVQEVEEFEDFASFVKDNEEDIVNDFAGFQEMLEKELAKKDARSDLASNNAQHPVRFAAGSAVAALAAAVSAIKDIPKQYMEERKIAEEAGKDATTSLENAGKAVAERFAGIRASAKEHLSISEKVCAIYSGAVGKMHDLWHQKAKPAIAKAVKTAVKGFDISMEFISRGAWSKSCYEKMMHVAEAKAKSERYQDKMKFADKLAAFSVDLHCKLAGINYQPVDTISPTGYVNAGGAIEGSATGYWHDVKKTVWSNEFEGQQIGRDDALGRRTVEGVAGVVSPHDIAVAKSEYRKDKSYMLVKQFEEGVSAMVKGAAREVAKTGKEIGETLGEIGKRVGGTVQNMATEAAGMAVAGAAAVRVGGLRIAKTVCEKASLVEKSSERRALQKQEKASRELLSVQKKIEAAEKKLGEIGKNAPEKRQYSLKEEEQNKLVAAAKEVESGSPTAATVKYLKSMSSQIRRGERKAAVGSVVDKMVNGLKNSGLKVAAHIDLADLKWQEAEAIDALSKATDKVAEHKERKEKGKDFASKAKAMEDKIDKIAFEAENEGFELD